jgi:hypothetical protein
MAFTPKNVSQLLVAKTDVSTAFNAATTAAAKKATLVNVGDYAVIATPSAVPVGSSITYTVNQSAGLIVKTGTGLKVSEQLVAADQDSFLESALIAGAAKVVTLTYPAISPSETYVANVVLHDGIGGILNERIVNAYVVLDADSKFHNGEGVLVVATLTNVLAELASLLQGSLDFSNEGFVITSTATTLVVQGGVPNQVVGAIDGIANPFEVKGGTKPEAVAGQASFFSEVATQVLTVAGRADDLVQLKNLEWFMSGYDKDPYRDIAWPVSFVTDNNVTGAGIAIGDKVGIYQFHKDRLSTNIERQHRQLICVGLAAGSGASAINAALSATATTAV